jgi:excisionase family DNA binding protein
MGTRTIKKKYFSRPLPSGSLYHSLSAADMRYTSRAHPLTKNTTRLTLTLTWLERTSMRRRRQQINGTDLNCCDLADAPKAVEPSGIPFVDRLACTIAEACEVTGLGRTKLYELIGDGHIETTAIGRRRLVLVQSLLSLLKRNR